MKLISKLIAFTLLISVISCDEKGKSSDSSDPKKEVTDVIEDYYEAISKADFDKASEFCEGDAQELMEDIAKAFDDNLSRADQDEWESRLEDFKDVKVKSVDVDGDEATVEIEEYNDEEVEYHLIKVKGKWLIEFDRGQLRDMEETLEIFEEIGRYGDRGRYYNEREYEYPSYDYEETLPDIDEDFYYCNDGREIPYSYLNDGDCDCNDCEDENVFFCDDGKAIRRAWVHDDECDCDDCSDE